MNTQNGLSSGPYTNYYDTPLNGGTLTFGVNTRETPDGFIGSVLFDGVNVWETDPFASPDQAARQARRHVVRAVRTLLTK